MMRSIIRRTTTLAVLGALAVGSSLPAAAESGVAERVTQRQSILTELSNTGEAGTSRVFTQLSATGNGPVTVSLPQQSTSGLRSLDGFGSPDVNGDEVIWTLDASKGGTARSVADNTADLPVSVAVTYRLDGEEISPRDLAGRTGKVEVEYVVSNLTAEPREIISFDAENNKTVETVDIAVPMVGSLGLNLGPRFANISAPGGITAGDGRGNTVVQFSLLLFAPLGSDTQTVTWTADAQDIVIPETSLQVLPVDDKSFNSLNSTADAYKGAMGSLSTLGNGALILDSNLQLLGSGASQLLDGLGQLADGAGKLSDGLANSAAPGARELSAGMSKAREGGGKLSTGLGELSLGAGRLSDGLGSAREGGDKLANGLGDLSAGAGKLSDGLGAARAGGEELATGLQDRAAPGAQALADGLTHSAAPGAQALADGLAGSAAPGADQINAGITKLLGALGDETDSAGAGTATLLGGLNDLLAGLNGSVAPGTEGLKQLTGGLNASFGPDAGGLDAGERAQAGANGLQSGRTLLNAIRGSGVAPGSFDYSAVANDVVCLNADCTANATVEEILATGKPTVGIPAGGVVDAIMGSVQTGLQGNADDLGTLPADCATAKTIVSSTADPDGLAVIMAASCIAAELDGGIDTLIIPGLTRVRGGVSNPAAFDSTNPGFNPTCTPSTVENGLQPCGVVQALTLLEAGSGALAAGLDDAAEGAGALATGIAGAATGAGQLSTGITAAATGAGSLADGLGQLDDGADQLAAGAGKAAAGAGDLGDGLRQLDEGGYKLAAGAGKAASGSRDLASGLVQLDDGAAKLATGLGDAADGSVKLAEGLVSAEEGGAKIADGTARLSSEGFGNLIEGISGGRQGASADYETVRALIQRGREGAFPYGVAEGAEATTVYKFDLAGVGTEEGPSTPLLVVLALVALTAAGGLGLALKRRLAA